VALICEFYRGLPEAPQGSAPVIGPTSNVPTTQDCHLEVRHSLLGCPGQIKTTPLWSEQAVHIFLCTRKIGQQPDCIIRCSHDQSHQPSIRVDGKPTQRNRSATTSRASAITVASPSTRLRLTPQLRHPKPAAAGRTTFTVTGEPEATIEAGCQGDHRMSRKTKMQSTSTGVQPGSRGLLSTPLQL